MYVREEWSLGSLPSSSNSLSAQGHFDPQLTMDTRGYKGRRSVDTTKNSGSPIMLEKMNNFVNASLTDLYQVPDADFFSCS